MTIYRVLIINKTGGLIFNYDHNINSQEVEKTFSYPLYLRLKDQKDAVVVEYGQKDGIHVGQVIVAINGKKVNGSELANSTSILAYLADEANYPLSIKFAWPKLSTNEKVVLSSLFYAVFQMSVQLSPEEHSSGIETIEMEGFKLQCFQTLTGVKFIVMSDPKQNGLEAFLRKMYELYADYVLKNPFYTLDMPIKCEMFDQNLLTQIDILEKNVP